MTTREDVFQALFDLGSNLTWGAGQRFEVAQRRLKTFDDVPMPAFFQAESANESTTQTTRMPSKRTWRAEWVIYLDTGRDSDATPASDANALLDAIDAALGTTTDPDQAQTLGGMVHKCWIDGETIRALGDLDQTTVLVVPISILVP